MARPRLFDRLILGNTRPPVFIHDSVLERPGFVIGNTGAGKSEWMLSRAFSGASKGRPVIVVDGKADRTTLDALHYYNGVVAGRPFYALNPAFGEISHTWNPLICPPGISAAALKDSIFNAYAPPDRGGDRRAGEYYYDAQRAIWSALFSILRGTGLRLNFRDMLAALKYPAAWEVLGNMVDIGHTGNEYQELLAMRNRFANTNDDISKVLGGLVNWLEKVQHWTLNSYNPDVNLEDVITSDATLYVGLPINLERDTMSVIGKIFLNQLRLLSAGAQTIRGRVRKQVDCFIDEAGALVDPGTADWACQARTSGFRPTFMFQTHADSEQISKDFAVRLRTNAPNLVVFNPNDYATAKICSDLFGQEWRNYDTLNRSGEIQSVRGGSAAKVNPEWILSLRKGQYFFKPCDVTEDQAPYFLSSPMLPPKPDYRVFCCQRREKPEVAKGMYLAEKIRHWMEFGKGRKRS